MCSVGESIEQVTERLPKVSKYMVRKVIPHANTIKYLVTNLDSKLRLS